MEICIDVGGTIHCYVIPSLEIPIKVPHVPIPHNYPQLFHDAMVIASYQAAAAQVSDAGVRAALQDGVHAATRALQVRGGSHVSVKNEAAKKA